MTKPFDRFLTQALRAAFGAPGGNDKDAPYNGGDADIDLALKHFKQSGYTQRHSKNVEGQCEIMLVNNVGFAGKPGGMVVVIEFEKDKEDEALILVGRAELIDDPEPEKLSEYLDRFYPDRNKPSQPPQPKPGS